MPFSFSFDFLCPSCSHSLYFSLITVLVQNAADKFHATAINGLALLALDEQALVVLGIDDPAERRVILGEIEMLRQAPQVLVEERGGGGSRKRGRGMVG